MESVKIVQTDGKTTTLEASIVETFQSALRGTLLKAGDAGYDEARTIWNAMIDRKPALIVCCTGAADVQTAVKFAAEHNLLTSIKGGGHNIAGSAVCEGGLMIDLSLLKTVRVDPDAKVAHVGPAATLGDVDHETQPFGLAVPTGINSTTGIAGLTLGGGFGWLSRKYGMTIDSLKAVDIVTADGSFLRASADENPDLFWALRGGGGNFGVVTRFEFQLHEAGPEVLAGLIVMKIEDAKQAIQKYREFCRNLSEETCVWIVLRQAPPLPFLPEDVHGADVLVFAFCHIGDKAEGEKAIAPIRTFGNVVGEFVGPMPFAAWQTSFDPLLTPGARNYWKSHNFLDIPDDLIDVAIKYTKSLPSSQCEIFFAQLGGKTSSIANDATAYPHRDANFVCNVHGRWDDAGDDESCIAWSREFFDAAAPFATGGVYINFMTDDESGRVGKAYGSSMERLATIKKKYDPNNLFRMNQNVKPA